MLRKVFVAAALLFSASAFADECATRVVTDKIYDSKGATIMTEESRTSCGNKGSNLAALVGIDDRCYYFDTPGGRQLACQYPDGNWVAFGDVPVEAIDAFSGGKVPQSGNYGTRTDYVPNNNSLITIFSNFMKYFSSSLDSESKKLHEKAIYFMVEHAENGKVVSWQNQDGSQGARMKVVSTMPVNGGLCRKYLVELRVGKNIRNLNESACINISTNQWHFYQ